ncbi:MAG TPA: sigma-70 family RNA polymerase sigma factor [Clostridia bacterium]|nr:sigma-70 family RNA polymerase sigma factor [Clostridia bacterium]
MQEAELIRHFKNGDTDAFDVIYADYYKPVYYYINRLVNDKSLADDLTQETLIKVLGGLKDADEEKNLSPWIYRIAHNTCVDYLRKNRVTLELIDDIICCDSEANSPEYHSLNREKQKKINEALRKISEKYRRALLLRDFSDLPYKEIASLLKLNECTVKTLVRRARQQFQKVYAEIYK